jgi:putative Holliday junction resolvase
MPIGLLKDISSTCPAGKRLLGLDLGTKTIGLALSNDVHTIATPLRTVQRRKFTLDIQDISREIREFAVGGYILGYPLNMDGTEGPRCQSVRHFAEEMRNHPDIFGKDPWIALWDERLSTASVEDFLIETVDMSRTKRKQVIDALAAQHILQGALDYLGRVAGGGVTL